MRRKDILNIIAKISKKLHVQDAVYSLCKHLPFRRISIDAPELYLASVSPEKKNSCICANNINENPQYDVKIIIPVYNVAKYLEQCVKSVVQQQTRYSYNAVFINDGSTDESRTILDRYAHYPCISIIDTQNQGVSAARNIGLKLINARYIMFVDSDDYLALDAVEKLVSKADEMNADIVEGNNIYFQNNKVISRSKHVNAEGFELLLNGVVWGKVYKAHLWHHISFPLDYRYEDTLDWMLMYQFKSKKVTIGDVIYYYRCTPTGFTKGYNHDKRRIETYWVTKQLLSDARKLGLEFSSFYYKMFLHQCKLNTSRVAILGDLKADKALFEAHRQLRDLYFKALLAEGEKEKRIESALLNDDFKEYFLYCLFLY